MLLSEAALKDYLNLLI